MLTASMIADAVRWACRLDVAAAKPGNVSVASPGHGMRADDFLASAEAIAAPLSEPGRKVGERIAAAVEATGNRVGMNTNLGIVLLAAPLAHAALTARPGETLERATGRVLAELDSDDATQAFRAIVQARPAGLGEVARLDVRGPAEASLLEAMREAAHRDTIARQYANGFGDVFRFGVRRFLAAFERHGSEEQAAVSCFLAWLARFPDTHVARKHGIEFARQVSDEAMSVRGRVDRGRRCRRGEARRDVGRFTQGARHQSRDERRSHRGESVGRPAAGAVHGAVFGAGRGRGPAPQRKVDAWDGSARVIAALESTVFRQPQRRRR